MKIYQKSTRNWKLEIQIISSLRFWGLPFVYYNNKYKNDCFQCFGFLCFRILAYFEKFK